MRRRSLAGRLQPLGPESRVPALGCSELEIGTLLLRVARDRGESLVEHDAVLLRKEVAPHSRKVHRTTAAEMGRLWVRRHGIDIIRAAPPVYPHCYGYAELADLGKCVCAPSLDRVSMRPMRDQESPMRVRILLADHSEADFYDMLKADEKPQFAGGLGDPLAHLHDRDMESDRPGRFFDHAPSTTGRRGVTAHHSAGAERSTHKHEAEFAWRIATLLEEGRRAGEFERLVHLPDQVFNRLSPS